LIVAREREEDDEATASAFRLIADQLSARSDGDD